jgi:Kdo2-lipid IVA lauroyltransferase/acyltransferase
MRLTKMSGAKIVPFFPLRREDGRGYQISVLPALDSFPSGDDLIDATRINALIEQQVRRAPDQYLWLHRRFKTRPEGEAGLYGWADKKRTRERDQQRHEKTDARSGQQS